MGTLSERIAEVRQLAGLSGRELDRLAGLTLGHVAAIEAGRFSPGAGTLEALRAALGVSLDWLVAGQGKAPPARVVATAVAAARARLQAATPPARTEEDSEGAA